MEGGYSFAEGGPIPYGDPQSQSYTANVSRSLHRHERQTPHAHPTRETAAQQPATNDLSQTFRPRFEDGSEIKLEFMPSLARRADQDLLDYLQKRKISFHFLNDIDDFLKRHPALLKACPSWCYQLSTLPPLEAYLFFVKGYLRPARYVDGALPAPEDEQIPVHPISLEHHSHDPELYDHITDIGQCLEILGRLDELVWLLTQAYHSGHPLEEAQVLLHTMATYAQPVDVLKYYEYCYLPSLQSNRHIQEHNILSHLIRQQPAPRPTLPTILPPRRPQRTAAQSARKAKKARHRRESGRNGSFGLKPSGVEIMNTHRSTRYAMARAADRGDDPVSVLLDCFAQDLQHKCKRRMSGHELSRFCEIAYERLEKEYLTGGRRDIVNLIMGMASEIKRNRHSPSHFDPFVNNPTGARFGIRSKHIKAAVNTVKHLYGQEARRGHVPALAHEIKKAEYRLADVVGWYARADGSMNKSEYEFLRQKFPWRRFDRTAEYDLVNPERLDVLLLLQSWI